MGLILDKLDVDTTKNYNALDYFNLPEGSPYQLIEGELIMTPSPNTYHQAISRNLELVIFDHVEKNELGFAFDAPIDVYLDDNNAYQPDIIFISKENKSIIKEKGILGAPDLVIEILSPSTAYYDIKTKKIVYEKTGVKEYIIIDPINKTIETFIERSLKINKENDVKTKGSTYGWAKEPDKSLSSGKDKKLFIHTLNLEVLLERIFKHI
jgi:Uma2 family endonuclease